MVRNAYMQDSPNLLIDQAESGMMTDRVYDVDHVVLHVLYILYILVLPVHHRDRLKLMPERQTDSSANR